MPCVRALFLLALLSPPLVAGELLRLVADPWPPFNDHDLPHNGLASDLVQQALHQAGYRTLYSEAPWERAMLGLKRGEHDVLINAWFSDERTRFGYFSRPYLINRIRFIQRKGANIAFAQLADLYRYQIAVVRGYAYTREFDQDERLQRVKVSGFESAARMLYAGRVQLALEDEWVARYHLGRELAPLRDELEFLPKPLSENGLRILVRLSHPQHAEIAARFDQAIQAMQADGRYAETFRRHGMGM